MPNTTSGDQLTRSSGTSHRRATGVRRQESRAIRDYLEALAEQNSPPSQVRSTATVQARIAEIELLIPRAEPINKVLLAAEKVDLAAELKRRAQPVDMKALEDDFVAIAAEYSRRNGISHEAWREMNVSGAVLKRAGIHRP